MGDTDADSKYSKIDVSLPPTILLQNLIQVADHSL